MDKIFDNIGTDEFYRRMNYIINREFETNDIVCNLINLSRKRKVKRKYYNKFLADVRLLYKIRKYRFKWQCPKKQREIWSWCKNKCYKPSIIAPKLKRHPEHILKMNKPTREDWKMAIWNNVELVKHISDYDLQELAIIKDVNAVKYIKNPADELGMLAILFDQSIIGEIKKPTENQEHLAVMLDSKAYYSIKKPRLTTQLLAVSINGDIYYDIKNPVPDLKELFRELYPCAYEILYKDKSKA